MTEKPTSRPLRTNERPSANGVGEQRRIQDSARDPRPIDTIRGRVPVTTLPVPREGSPDGPQDTSDDSAWSASWIAHHWTGTEVERYQPEEPKEPRTLSPNLVVVAGSLVVLAILLVFGIRAQLHQPVVLDENPDPARYLSQGPPTQLPPVGSYVESKVLANGDVKVTHWIRSSTPLTEVELNLPILPPGSDPARATDVEVAADQRFVDGARRVGAQPERYLFATSATTVYVTYSLIGVVERSPSVPGRAIARAVALDVSYRPRSGPTRVRLVGTNVRSVACTARGAAQERPCGSPEPGSWLVELRGGQRRDQVLAQIDLG